MTTEQRIAKAEYILSSMERYRNRHCTLETDVEKVLVQLLMICKNQQLEIEAIKNTIQP